MIDVLDARRGQGATLVIATHSQVIADGLADHTLDLNGAA